MEIITDTRPSFSGLEKSIRTLVSKGIRTIMLFHAEGGLDQKRGFKTNCDTLLRRHQETGTRIFGGIFPGIIDNGRLLDRGSILIGFQSPVHVITLETLEKKALAQALELGLTPVKKDLAGGRFKTLFVIGDGFGELNHNLIQALNRVTKGRAVNVIGGLAGRNRLKASHFNIFTPAGVIQNGAVLAFSRLESGIGARHGWVPLPESECCITRTNGCFVEEINSRPALDFYLDFVAKKDQRVAQRKTDLASGNADLFFEEVAVRYPLGLLRIQKNKKQVIDRTAISVGADRSLQFSAEIPVKTRACILHLKGRNPKEMCFEIGDAAQNAYIESLRTFPRHVPESRILMMDCFGRKKMVDHLQEDYQAIEFQTIAADQQEKSHSPVGALTFGEISSMAGGYVELHNKTAVVASLEDN